MTDEATTTEPPPPPKHDSLILVPWKALRALFIATAAVVALAVAMSGLSLASTTSSARVLRRLNSAEADSAVLWRYRICEGQVEGRFRHSISALLNGYEARDAAAVTESLQQLDEPLMRKACVPILDALSAEARRQVNAQLRVGVTPSP